MRTVSFKRSLKLLAPRVQVSGVQLAGARSPGETTPHFTLHWFVRCVCVCRPMCSVAIVCYRAARNATAASDENSVCPSVCLTVKRVDCDRTEERSVQIFIPYDRSFSLVFWEEEWFVEATPSTWNFGSTGSLWSEIADFQPIFAHSAPAVTPGKKVQLTLIGSPPRAYQWA